MPPSFFIPQIRSLGHFNPISLKPLSLKVSAIAAPIARVIVEGLLIFFIEDDYLHFEPMLEEMIASYERIASQLNRDICMCPTDYPYLYTRLENSKILLGNKYHWRTVNESLLTFLTSKDLINKYWDELILMAEHEHSPFETPLHKIYEKELCLSPIPSLAIHCTNVNSIFGLSPNINWKKLWEKNEV